MSVKVSIRDRVRDELRQSKRVIEAGNEVIPRFWIDTPEGSLTVMIQLPNDTKARANGMQMIADFMAWRQTTRFIHSAETVEPDLVYAIGVERNKVAGLYSLIARKPTLRFSQNEALPVEAVGDEIPAMLPSGTRSIGKKRAAELERIFALHDQEAESPVIVIRME